MTLVYHPAVHREVTEILRHYDRISPHLGDAFWAELMQLLERVAEHPRRFHLATEDSTGPIFVDFLITCCFVKPARQFASLLFGMITVTLTTEQVVVD